MSDTEINTLRAREARQAVESLRFDVLGPPVPKGRPRFARGRVVTPKRTREYERLVHEVATLYCGNWRRDGMYRVTLDFIAHRPLRGDVDNYAKALLDGLQGAAFDNDSQVSEIVARKHATGLSDAYGPQMARVLVERIGDMPVKRETKRRSGMSHEGAVAFMREQARTAVPKAMHADDYIVAHEASRKEAERRMVREPLLASVPRKRGKAVR